LAVTNDHRYVTRVFQIGPVCFADEIDAMSGGGTSTTMQSSASILVVDDDPGIREVLSDYLSQHGFDVRGAASAAEMDREIAAGSPDVIVLDLMMPGEDGLSVVRRMNRRGPPIIMLSAMGEDTDRIVGLELGADDYLAKPCNPRELLARVRAVLRRPREGEEAAPGQGYVFAGWRVDLMRRELVRPDGRLVPLSAGEFALLLAFIQSPGRVLTRDQLLERARGGDADIFDRAMDVQISRLRKKLDDGSGLEMIQTLRGEGYMFDVKVDAVKGAQ
jgi:two-component system OmpR family response regulator